jgi:predicted nucleotidyltransferase
MFIVIGGHAVAAHGFSRTTGDLDLLVSRSDSEKWKPFLQFLGYGEFHDGGNFLQFESASADEWDIDLMLTDEQTFTRMFSETRPSQIAGGNVQIPVLEHLLALKLHALKNSHTRRFLKDFEDVCNLVQANKIDMRSAEFKELVLKFGNEDLYEKLLRLAADT